MLFLSGATASFDELFRTERAVSLSPAPHKPNKRRAFALLVPTILIINLSNNAMKTITLKEKIIELRE
jgi:hypothetical protein